MKNSSLVKQLPNLLTCLNMLLGLVVLFSQVWKGPNYRLRACLLILLAACVDALDGKLARRLGVESSLGKQLDSFADIISFGIAPVLITLTHTQVRAGGWLSYACLGLYVLAAAFRLARFNIGDYRDYFLGLPITAAGTIVVAHNLLLHYSTLLQGRLGVPLTWGLFLVLAGLMVSRLPIRRWC